MKLLLNHVKLFTKDEILYYTHYAIVADYLTSSRNPVNTISIAIEHVPILKSRTISKIDSRLIDMGMYEKLQNLYDLNVLCKSSLEIRSKAIRSNIYLKMWFHSLPISKYVISESDFKSLDEDDKQNEMLISHLFKKQRFSLDFPPSFLNCGRIVQRRLLAAHPKFLTSVRESISNDFLVVKELLKTSNGSYAKLSPKTRQDARVVTVLALNCKNYDTFVDILKKGSKSILDLLVKLLEDRNLIEKLISDQKYQNYYKIIKYSQDLALYKFALHKNMKAEVAEYIVSNLDQKSIDSDKKFLMDILKLTLPKKIAESQYFNEKQVLLLILKHRNSKTILSNISDENFKDVDICNAIFNLDIQLFPLVHNSIGNNSELCLKVCTFNPLWFSLISDKLKSDAMFVQKLCNVLINRKSYPTFLNEIDQKLRNNPDFWSNLPYEEAFYFLPSDIIFSVKQWIAICKENIKLLRFISRETPSQTILDLHKKLFPANTNKGELIDKAARMREFWSYLPTQLVNKTTFMEWINVHPFIFIGCPFNDDDEIVKLAVSKLNGNVLFVSARLAISELYIKMYSQQLDKTKMQIKQPLITSETISLMIAKKQK